MQHGKIVDLLCKGGSDENRCKATDSTDKGRFAFSPISCTDVFMILVSAAVDGNSKDDEDLGWKLDLSYFDDFRHVSRPLTTMVITLSRLNQYSIYQPVRSCEQPKNWLSTYLAIDSDRHEVQGNHNHQEDQTDCPPREIVCPVL